MADAPPSASQRYIDLVNELADDLGRRRGWKSEVARQLGVHHSFVARVADGKVKSIGADLIERAMGRLGLPRSYFFAEVPPGEGSSMLPSVSAEVFEEQMRRAHGRVLRDRFFAAVKAQNEIEPPLANELADLVLRTDAVQAALALRSANTSAERRAAAFRLLAAIDTWL